MVPTTCGGSKAPDGLVPKWDGVYDLLCLFLAVPGAAVAWKAGSLLGSPTLAVLSGPCRCQHGLEQALCSLAPSLPGPC